MKEISRRWSPRSGSGTAIPRPEGTFDPVARALEGIGEPCTPLRVRRMPGASRGFQEEGGRRAMDHDFYRVPSPEPEEEEAP